MKIQKLSYLLFGWLCEKIEMPGFEKALKKSRLFIPFPVYLSMTCLTEVTAAAAAGILAAVFWLLLPDPVTFGAVTIGAGTAGTVTAAGQTFQIPEAIVLLIPAAVLTAAVLIAAALLPYLYAYDKKLKIERQLPFAVNYMSAMAVAGISAETIFCKTGEKKMIPIYGELSKEFAVFAVHTTYLGKDDTSALDVLSKETPSPLFAEFIAGARNTIVSGGDFQKYMTAKKYEYQSLVKQKREKQLQFLDLLSEIYITAYLAAPVFFIIMMFATMSFSGVKTGQMSFLAYQVVPFLGVFFLLIADISDEYG